MSLYQNSIEHYEDVYNESGDVNYTAVCFAHLKYSVPNSIEEELRIENRWQDMRQAMFMVAAESQAKGRTARETRAAAEREKNRILRLNGFARMRTEEGRRTVKRERVLSPNGNDDRTQAERIHDMGDNGHGQSPEESYVPKTDIQISLPTAIVERVKEACDSLDIDSEEFFEMIFYEWVRDNRDHEVVQKLAEEMT